MYMANKATSRNADCMEKSSFLKNFDESRSKLIYTKFHEK